MTKSEKRLIRGWVYFGIFLITVLSVWAGDWWSWKLIITIPLGSIAYFSIALPISKGSIMYAKDKYKQGKG
jgi:hypothetical protein